MPSANALASAEGGFDRFRFHENIVRGLQAAGFQEPRPIQDDTIPACLEGRDVMGLAQTGTGKTAAFALPILEYFVSEPGPGPRALILAPTRELANQIDAETRLLAQFTSVKTTTVFGGVPARAQIQALRRQPEIVVGCPGRVLDLLQQRQLDLRDIEVLVLDEADHMFDMGFLPDIKRILAALPSDRQNLLFSATMPKAIRQLAEQILNDPHVVEIAHTAPALRIEHALYPIAAERKKDLLDRLLAEDDCNSAIVFTRTKHRAKRLAIQLSKQGLSAIALQGNMSQAQRDRAMNGFRKGSYDILVATDIAARGLDVAGIDYVINFDPPSTPDIYTHRIGRTGRSEASGKACTFVTRDDADWVRDTERVLDASIPQRYWPGFDREPIVAGKGARGARPAGRPSNAKTRSGGGDRRNKGPAKRGRSRKRGGRSASSAANR
jgi:ATP-dependent RNA helicase RhlE